MQLTRISNTAAVSPSAPEASDRPAAAMPREVNDGGRDDGEEEEGGGPEVVPPFSARVWVSAHPSGCSHPSAARAWSAATRSISRRLRSNPASARACVARMYARSPRASRSSSGPPSPGRGHQAGPPPGLGHRSSQSVRRHTLAWETKASCSLRPRWLAVDRPRRETSMRRLGTVTPRSYASSATSANSCAAKREPRRRARKLTCRRERRDASWDASGESASNPEEDARATRTRREGGGGSAASGEPAPSARRVRRETRDRARHDPGEQETRGGG